MYIISIDGLKNPIFAHSATEDNKAEVKITVQEDTKKVFTGEFTIIESEKNPFESI